MAALNVILLVLFVITCALIIFLVLLQNEEGDSIGGLFAGGSNSAFGSRSGNILTKSTYILVTIFFASSFLLAVLNKTSSAPTDGIIKEGQQLQKENATPWYDQEKSKTEETKKVENKGASLDGGQNGNSEAKNGDGTQEDSQKSQEEGGSSSESEDENQ